MSASLIGRLGQVLSGYPPLRCRCRSRARASLRTRHQGPSVMGFEDEVEQSNGRNHAVKAAASLFAALGSRAEVFFLGEARLGGVAAVCDATEGVFDRKRIECIGIVVARPFFEMGMARVRTGSDRFEPVVETLDAAAIPR